jgi:hypothetical protein
MITTAAIQLLGRSSDNEWAACARCSAMTSRGISRMASARPAGTRVREPT